MKNYLEDNGGNGQKIHLITDMNSYEARKFFLKHQSYCTIDLPPYFDFEKLLTEIADILNDKLLSFFACLSDARKSENVNYRLLHNKDGRYAWRPLELIHPVLYVSLVNEMTENIYWDDILDRFKEFRCSKKIECFSLPGESLTTEKDKAEIVTNWWLMIEQKSIELSLDYEFMVHTDIVDCYGAIYTHSIAWSLHKKKIAKQQRNNKHLIGNIIDRHIRDMRHGQTNGIPQGSVLMDFVAEIVLGYADMKLKRKLKNKKISNYHILRYRDDYRIFINNPQDGGRIIKHLSNVMIKLGLKLNPAKTVDSNNVVRSSIKDDKVRWMFRSPSEKNLQQHLQIIHDHSVEFPNSGSLNVAMDNFYKRLFNCKNCNFPLPLIGIVVDIAYNNPKTYSITAAILSKLIHFLKTTDQKQIVKKIKKKFKQIPNTEHIHILLQRICVANDLCMDFNTPLCKLVSSGLNTNDLIWNNNWIRLSTLRELVETPKVIDQHKLKDVDPIVPIEEVELYRSYY